MYILLLLLLYIYTRNDWRTPENSGLHKNSTHRTRTRLKHCRVPTTDCLPLPDAELTSVVDRHWGASCNKNKHGADCCAADSVANPIAETTAVVAAADCDVWVRRRGGWTCFRRPTRDIWRCLKSALKRLKRSFLFPLCCWFRVQYLCLFLM